MRYPAHGSLGTRPRARSQHMFDVLNDLVDIINLRCACAARVTVRDRHIMLLKSPKILFFHSHFLPIILPKTTYYSSTNYCMRRVFIIIKNLYEIIFMNENYIYE